MVIQGKDCMPTTVIYHAGCYDGFCCAWLFHKVFPDAEFVPAHHGTEPPAVHGRNVYVADFSYKRPAMRTLLSQARKVVVLDHHKTAQEELNGLCDEFVLRPDLIANPPGSELPIVRFDMGKSGARLTWDFLFGDEHAKKYVKPDELRPWLVDYTEDRDLWRWQLPWSQDVNVALRSYPMDFAVWDEMAKREPAALAVEGASIRRREDQIVHEHVGHAREIELAGHRVLAVNATVLFSEIAGELAQGRPFGACWFDRQDGKRQWSLRSRQGGVDVAALARKLGGGGHANAAGFEEEAPPPMGGRP